MSGQSLTISIGLRCRR